MGSSRSIVLDRRVPCQLIEENNLEWAEPNHQESRGWERWACRDYEKKTCPALNGSGDSSRRTAVGHEESLLDSNEARSPQNQHRVPRLDQMLVVEEVEGSHSIGSWRGPSPANGALPWGLCWKCS